MTYRIDRRPPTADRRRVGPTPPSRGDRVRLLVLWTSVLGIGAVGACSDEPVRPSPAPVGVSEAVPALVMTRLSESSIENRYIVRLWDEAPNVRAVAAALAQQEGRALHFLYEYTIRGFAATLPPGAVDELRRHPQVRGIYPDALIEGVWAGPGWGLDRIDQRELPLDSSYAPYGSGGSGVNVYIMDTGIYPGHSQFGGRAVTGPDSAFDATRDTANQYYAQDCWGQSETPPQLATPHGTPVAAIVGGSTYGVAPQVRLISVRVACRDTIPHVALMAAADWIAGNFVKPAVVNFSGHIRPGAPDSLKTMFDEAMAAIVDSGVPVIVAAGNENDDACDYAPARIAETITVGASTDADDRWQGSNYGECVDLFAPGLDVMTAYPSSDPPDPYETKPDTGTSFAAPYVTGVAARYLAANPTATPAQVRSYILGMATEGALSNLGTGSPNLLAFTPRILSAAIDGPTSITEAGNYNWYAVTDGGDYTYTYLWERRDKIGESWGSWWTRGTASMLTLSVNGLDPEFELRLTVDSDENRTPMSRVSPPSVIPIAPSSTTRLPTRCR